MGQQPQIPVVIPPGQVNCEASRGLQCIRSHGGHCRPQPTVTTVIIIPGGISEVSTTIPINPGGSYNVSVRSDTSHVVRRCDVLRRLDQVFEVASSKVKCREGPKRATSDVKIREKKVSLIKSGAHPPPCRCRPGTTGRAHRQKKNQWLDLNVHFPSVVLHRGIAVAFPGDLLNISGFSFSVVSVRYTLLNLLNKRVRYFRSLPLCGGVPEKVAIKILTYL